MKGTGGVIVDLGQGRSGSMARACRRGALLVQVAGWAEPGKAPPVTARLLLKALSPS